MARPREIPGGKDFFAAAGLVLVLASMAVWLIGGADLPVPLLSTQILCWLSARVFGVAPPVPLPISCRVLFRFWPGSSCC